MSTIFDSDGPISMDQIHNFIIENTDRNIPKNTSLRDMFQVMFEESFQPDNGRSLFSPDRFSEMYGMLGYRNALPEITMFGDSTKTILRRQS